MAKITFSGVAHCYSGRPESISDYALQPMTTTWDDGRTYALLGPSGCGKTTLLNIISGLVHPSEGHVLFDGIDVTNLPTSKRNIAQVFQFPVIYKIMSVFDNLAFPLKCRNMSTTDVESKVLEVAEQLNLTPYLNTPASKLSSDAKQLISLGRGLVRDHVAAILLDEPLTVVDPHLKWLLRRKLKEVNEQYRQTMILVTHDQNEALTFAEMIIVMKDGCIVQTGTPRELFEQPAHTFVGYFIGSPSMNFMPCHLRTNGLSVGDKTIPLPTVNNLSKYIDSDLEIGIRPEFLELTSEHSEQTMEVSILSVKNLGSYCIYTVLFAKHKLKVKIHGKQMILGKTGFIRFPSKWTKIYHQGKLVKLS